MDEIDISMKRYEHGYDLKHDARYNKWKEQYEAGIVFINSIILMLQYFIKS